MATHSTRDLKRAAAAKKAKSFNLVDRGERNRQKAVERTAVAAPVTEDATEGVIIPLAVAELIIKVFLPVNERRMRSAHPSVVDAVALFKRAVLDRQIGDAGRGEGAGRG